MIVDPKIVIAENIKKYLEQHNMTQKTLAEKINIKPSTVSDYLKYRSKPSHGIIQKIADVFGIHKSDIDTTYKKDTQGLTTSHSSFGLSTKEERDIATDLERMIGELETNEALAFHGEPMDDETKELMKISLENSLRLAKQMAKQKFNPNKNK
ncbi:helix-turn-helix domain-containing protein [Paenibacillus qinlingensis]|uniref:helix-turn-helix domain-containing protein n=1 Tax=Paenibacillus qinlingensis TaxID=1837343 RepID=UPI001566DCC9|nr:helix-turn-helix transcriptional regulator [Paenibacillus qinlingensis]NQX57542.1 helix-turn-helix transcriptional regulator [Paenibacillus qinlingensis]